MKTCFDAIADPTRREILDLLRERPRLVGELTEALDISQPGVSKHLRILREAGMVTVRQDGQRRWYTLQAAPFVELDNWLASYRHLWDERYQRLDDYLTKLRNQETDNDSNNTR